MLVHDIVAVLVSAPITIKLIGAGHVGNVVAVAGPAHKLDGFGPVHNALT